MGGIGVEEAAAVGAEHLDGDLRGHGPDGNRLLGAFQRRRIHIGAEGLRHALPDEEQPIDDTNRQQDVKRAAGDIDPEVANRAHRCAREAADEGHRQHDARRSRQEVLVRQAQHLHEIGQRAFAAVVLPVRVGDEAHRSVEGEIRSDGRLLRRIERQPRLQAHQAVKDQESADVEEQHRHRVGDPVLLAPLVDAAEGV